MVVWPRNTESRHYGAGADVDVSDASRNIETTKVAMVQVGDARRDAMARGGKERFSTLKQLIEGVIQYQG